MQIYTICCMLQAHVDVWIWVTGQSALTENTIEIDGPVYFSHATYLLQQVLLTSNA